VEGEEKKKKELNAEEQRSQKKTEGRKENIVRA
jgi:hypothetical protein